MTFFSRSTLLFRVPILRSCHNTTFVRGFKPRKKPGTYEKLTPITPKSDGPEFTRISKYLLYTAGVIPATFTGCIIWNYESVRKAVQSRLDSVLVQQKSQKKTWNLRDELNHTWNQMSPGKKLAWAIVTANITVFLLWQPIKTRGLLYRYFSCAPTKAHSVVSSTLSAFSHQNGLHLFVNMYVLLSFSEILIRMMGREQFLATYVSAATFSGMFSAIVKILRRSTVPSVGASGALMCMVAIFCQSFPDAGLQIAIVGDFIPHSFKASTAFMGIVMFDTIGLLLKWRVLDHAGHLGGVLFGLAMVYLIKQGTVKKFRRRVLDVWHKVRK